MVILTREIPMVSEEEDGNNETMTEGGDGIDKGAWKDEYDEPPDHLRYNGEGNNNYCTTQEHAEDIFEAINQNTSTVRDKSCNSISHSTELAKPLNLS